MTTSAWLLQFQGSFNKWVIWFHSGIPKHNYHPSTPSQSIKLHRVTTDNCQQVYLWKFIGNHPVQNWIIASRWMHRTWYLLVSRKVSLLYSMMDCEGNDCFWFLFNGPWNCTNLYSWSFNHRIQQKVRQEKIFASGRQWRKFSRRIFSPTVNFDTLNFLFTYNY